MATALIVLIHVHPDISGHNRFFKGLIVLFCLFGCLTGAWDEILSLVNNYNQELKIGAGIVGGLVIIGGFYAVSSKQQESIEDSE